MNIKSKTKSNLIRVLSVNLFMVFGFVGLVRADEPASSRKSVTLDVIADAAVATDVSEANYGSRRLLKVNGAPVKTTYLLFDLSSVADETILGMTLQLTVARGTADGLTRNVKLVTDASWEESELTYANAPVLDASTLVLGTFQGAATGEVIEIPLEQLGTIAGYRGQLFSVAIDSADAGELIFHAREAGASTPKLVVSSLNGMWISSEEIAALPDSGPAWEALQEAVIDMPGAFGGHNSNHDVHTLAAALVAARLNDTDDYNLTADNLIAAIGTEYSKCDDELGECNSLSISRNLTSYVIAADVIDFKHTYPTLEPQFRGWIQSMMTWDHPNQGGCAVNPENRCSITDKHEDKPNNHGTMAGAARLATALYLGDLDEVTRVAEIFKGWLGDRTSYADFDFDDEDLEWQCDPSNPVGINAVGCMKEGHWIDGAQPEEQRRCNSGHFIWPPCETTYTWENLQAVLVTAFLLQRAGYADVFEWEDQAILRAVKWLYEQADDPAEGDDEFQLPLIDAAYGTAYWDGSTVGHGKNMGWTDWTHPEDSNLSSH